MIGINFLSKIYILYIVCNFKKMIEKCIIVLLVIKFLMKEKNIKENKEIGVECRKCLFCF